jgi:lipopolysaccharide transport system permease protein
LLNLVRVPLMGGIPSIHSWVVCGVGAVVGWVIAIIVYARSRDRVAFWL